MIRHVLIAAAIAAAVATAAGAQAQAPVAPSTDDALWRAVGASRLSAVVEAPPFALKDLAGKVVDLKELRGQVVLVYFWTTW
jgi:cytochrome oxidase Cu insertion factor (SCO1/SenC/PrrC family)